MKNARKPRKSKGAAIAEHPLIPGVVWSSPDDVAPLLWSWPGYLPRGGLALLEGRLGSGKSCVAAAIAAAFTGGRALPGWAPIESRPVLWCAPEDADQTVTNPRLLAAGANLMWRGRIEVQTANGGRRPLTLPGDMLILEETCRAMPGGLIVFDPYISSISGEQEWRSEQQIRSVLDPLGAMLSATGVLGLLIRHLRKGVSGDVREHGLGSIAVAASSRVILRTDEHPQEPAQHTLSVVRCKDGPRAATLVYCLDRTPSGYPAIRWLGDSPLKAEEIAEGRASAAEADAMADAQALLRALIGSGHIPATDIRAEAERAEVTPVTLRRAKRVLGVTSHRVQKGQQGHWEWGPPEGGWPDTPAKPPSGGKALIV